MELLIQHGVNVRECDHKGRTALVYAHRSGCLKSVRLLQKYGLSDCFTGNVSHNRTQFQEEKLWNSLDDNTDSDC